MENISENKNYNLNSNKPGKGMDILTGLLAGVVYLIVMIAFIAFLFNIFNNKVATIISSLLGLGYPLAIVYLFIKKRRNIAIGLILLIVVPLAIFGGCLVIINS